MTTFRFVHLENAYEFAEEYQKPLCKYVFSLKRAGPYINNRG